MQSNSDEAAKKNRDAVIARIQQMAKIFDSNERYTRIDDDVNAAIQQELLREREVDNTPKKK